MIPALRLHLQRVGLESVSISSDGGWVLFWYTVGNQYPSSLFNQGLHTMCCFLLGRLCVYLFLVVCLCMYFGRTRRSSIRLSAHFAFYKCDYVPLLITSCHYVVLFLQHSRASYSSVLVQMERPLNRQNNVLVGD